MWWILIRKEILHILRDKGLLLFIIYAFSVDIVLAAKGFRLIPQNVSVAVYDEDRSASSRDLIARLRPPAFKYPRYLSSVRQIDPVMLESEVVLTLVIPSGFERDLLRGRAEVQVLVDGTQSTAAYLSATYLQAIINRFIQDRSTSTPLKVEIKRRVLFNPSSRDDLYEGLMEFFMVTTLIGMILPAMLIIREIEYGTVEQILISPLRPMEMLFTKVVSVLLFMTTVTVLSYLFVLKCWLGFPLKGGIWRFVLLILLYQLSTLGFSFIIGSIAKKFSQIGMLTIVIFTPMLLLSGGWVPPEALPEWLQMLSRLSPLKHLMNTGVSLLIRGAGFDLLCAGLLRMGIIGGLIFILGLSLYYRRLKRL